MNTRDDLKKISISEIPDRQFFSDAVYLDSNYVLTTPDVPFTKDLNKMLHKWGFRDVLTAGSPIENSASYQMPDEIDGEYSEAIVGSDNEQIIMAEKFITDFQRFAEFLFRKIVIKNELEYLIVVEEIKRICEVVKDSQRYILRVLRNLQPIDSYLVSHSVKGTVIALVIGQYLKLPQHRLIELGVGALLHEVGMLRLPSQLYHTNRALEPNEMKIIMAHPIFGYNILKGFHFPLPVQMVALEHHERENGSGYPRKITGQNISLYAKIISVACSYEALSSLRPHKDEVKDGHTGMLELLRNEGRQYNDTVIRALVFSLSIYPIGLYVLLANGKKGQVIDANPGNPRCPIVQVFAEFTPDGKNKIVETSIEGYLIVRPLNAEEIKT